MQKEEDVVLVENYTNNQILVSIFCVVYNHSKYIRKTLDGFIMQRTTFGYEVIVHDDASTDGTVEIIREYAERYSDIIKPILQEENQHSKGVKIAKTYLWPLVQGKYIAFCEGDDYWVDPYKLQKQYDAMEAHPEVDICAHRATVFHMGLQKAIEDIAPRDFDCVIPVEDVIAGGGGFVATNTLFYRSTLLFDVPEFREYYSIDYSLQIQGSLRGGMLYLNDCMSTYRYMVPGSWTDRQRQSRNHAMQTNCKLIHMLELLDECTNMQYHETISTVILQREIDQLSIQNKYKDILAPKYKSIVKKYPLSQKMKLMVKAYCPWTVRLYRKIHINESK